MTFYDLQNTGAEIQEAITKALNSVDTDSSQTISGVKNFTNGIQVPILSVQLTDARVSLYQYLENLLGQKVDKVSGKGLSTNDFTDYYKGTISSLMNGVATLNEEKLGFVFADELPSASSYANQKILYLIPSEAGSGYRDAYISNGRSWVQIGGAVDMSAYSTTAQMNAAIATAVANVDVGVTSFNGSTGAVSYTAPVTSVNGSTGAVTISVPTKTSDLTNDSGFLTQHQDISGKADVAALAAYTPTTNFATINGSSITGGGNVSIVAAEGQTITIDATPTSGSSNAVSSGGVYSEIDGGFYY